MSTVEGGPGGAPAGGLVKRVQDILLRPSPTWEVIDGEPATIGGLYRSWVIPLAAIPAVCGFIGMVVFGVGVFGYGYKPSILNAAVSSIVSYVMSLVGVFVIALIIDALATSFDGQKNQVQAFKVAAYSWTAAWVAGVFSLIPLLAIIGMLAGLYSFFLLYKGLPVLMKAPPAKALTYTLVVVVLAIVFWIIVGAITAPIQRMGMPGGGPFAGASSGTLTVPGGGSIDLNKMEKATRDIERQARTGEVELVEVSALEALLPGAMGGFSRGEVTTESGSAGAFGAASAKADYSRGDSTITLSVSDISSAGALAGLAGAFSVNSSRKEGDRYEKVGKVDGRMTIEEYDGSARSGEYAVLYGDRFMVQAEGSNVSMDELKAAVKAVDGKQLERMAK
jgi:hypothetical protein